MKPSIIVVMGVAGSGKTTHGQTLATALGWRFADADEFHPPTNVAKMSAGVPLTDQDRAPWLATLRAEIEQHLAAEKPLVLACSALKQTYRDALWVDEARMRLIFLDGPPELLAARLGARSGHFAGPALLESQLADLEPPANAIRINISDTTKTQVATARKALGL